MTPLGWLDDLVQRSYTAHVAELEAAAQDVARQALPRPLRRAVSHTRLLRLLYRLHPAWRPTICTVAGDPLSAVIVHPRAMRVVHTDVHTDTPGGK